MEFIFQILVGLMAMMLSGLGLMSMFAPQKMIANFAVQPDGISGLNTIRSVMGGFFLASVGMLVFGLLAGQSLAFIAVALLMAVAALGRIVGIVFDGFDKKVVPPLILELVFVGILSTAHMTISA